MIQKDLGFFPTPATMEVGEAKGKRESRKGGEQSGESLEEQIVLVQKSKRQQGRNPPPSSPSNIQP